MNNNNKKEIKFSPEWLYNSALNYLSKYSSSSSNLEKILERKSMKLFGNSITETSEIKYNILETIKKLKKLNFINDKEYAITKSVSLLKKGKPTKIISLQLKSLGVNDDDIKNAIKILTFEYSNEKTIDDLDFVAASIFVKKKKLI